MSEAMDAWRDAWDRQLEEVRKLADEPTGTPGASFVQFPEVASRALAVHPKQVEQANARAKKHGLGITYDPKGRPHLTSRNARKKLIRLEGFHDNDAGYGD